MKLVSLRCPNCDANINTEIGNRSTFFCPYCGSKIYVDDEVQRIEINVNHTYRKIDEARIQESRAQIRKSEAKRDIELKQLEFKENQERRKHQENKTTWIVMIILFLLPMMFLGIMAIDEDINEKQSIAEGKVQIGTYWKDFQGQNYETVVNELKARGFTNIETYDLDDAGWLKNKENTIKSVSVNGETQFYGYDYFNLTDKIVLTYH